MTAPTMTPSAVAARRVSILLVLCTLCILPLVSSSRAPDTTIDPLRKARYASKTSTHLEPVTNFRVGGRHQLQSLSSFQPFTNDNGHVHVLPDQVKVEFTVYGEDHSYDVDIMKNLYAPGTTSTVHREGGIVEQVPIELRAYTKQLANGWVTAVFRDDGIALITVNRDGTLLTIDPITEHERYIQSHTYSALSSEAVHGMVAHRSEDGIYDGDNLQQCGTKVVPGRENHHASAPHNTTVDLRSGGGRQLLAVAPWTDCFTPFVAKKLSDGVAADFGFYKASGGTVPATNAAIASIWASMNNVYLTQLNVFHEITETIIMATSGTYTWNQDRVTTACPTINANLDLFTAWRKASRSTTQGLWQLLTDCYPPPGTVGLGWIGVLCSIGYGTALSSKSSLTWTTVAHEVGHNFNAQHTFQLGQGKTGGIMDYGDGKLNGEYQFNTVYSKTEMCQEIVSSMATSSRYDMVPLAACWSSYAPSCGNGIVEQGEECDDSGASDCCNMATCRLKAGSQCTNGACCASCKYLPTSTQCGGSSAGSGYCFNGQCTDSFCGTYGMAYCGTQSANPCKQQCIASGVCNPMNGWTNSQTGLPLPVGIADGAVCNQNPYSTCQAAACVATASTVTYAWSQGTWSSCSVTCGTGSQTSIVTCKDNSQNVVPTTNCAGSPPASTRSCSGPVCMTYSWVSGGFGACTNDCGGGTQTQGVNCQNSASPPVIVPDTNCPAGTKPATSRACSTQACRVDWVYGTWTTCPVQCGGGTITRTVSCIQTKNNGTSTVTAATCTTAVGAAAATTQACNTQACATYDWVAANWGACSKSCGSGIRTRAVTCRDMSTNVVASSSSLCSGGAPIAQEPCNTAACPVYRWTFGTWAPCSRTCGSGTTTRNVFCVDNSTGVDVTVIDNYCTKTKPDQTSTCMTQNCPDFHWWATEWGACSKTCGSGTKTRFVYCHDMNIQPMSPVDAVAEQNCIDKQLVKLDSTSSCNEQACPTYVWFTGDWQSCSNSCGGGTQTRTAVCILQGSTSVVLDSMCSGAKPASTQTCNSAACGVYTWQPTPWSDCSVACGGGLRYRTITCKDQNGMVQPNAACTAGKPASQEACSTADCPVYWHTSLWTECSKKCEGGQMSRTVECRDQATDLPVASNKCLTSQPSTISDCNVQHCPQWYPQAWGTCSLRCGDGFQNRTILCLDYLLRAVDSTECIHNVPASVQPCSIIPCPHWHLQEWSACSQVCSANGVTGVQDRLVECRMPHDDPAWLGRLQPDLTLCPVDVPVSRRVCNSDPCTPNYWANGVWSTCSATCGTGTQTSTVTCMDSATNAPTDASKCSGVALPTTRLCNTQSCPVYEWYLPNGITYGACSATCGTGLQSRSVICRNKNATTIATYEVVADSFCAHLGSVPSTQPCTAPVCQNRGVCTTANVCYCRFGFKGDHCERWPFFSGLTTDASSFTAGVPGGETLPIKWYSGGNMPYVSLLLDRPSWTYPVYIARAIPNGGSYLYTIPKSLPMGDDYSIITWYSPATYNRSTSFAIADPCGYISCGTYGKCVEGTCQCLSGYTGTTCSLSPCAAAQCNEARSTCNELTGFCNCTTGYTGSQCRTPSSCAAVCQNGGYVPESIVTVGECGSCVCTNYWSGSTCATCPLQCYNGGSPDADCKYCSCKAGFYGDRCQCSYLVGSIKLSMTDSSWLVVDANVWRFNDTFANDLAAAIPGTTAAMFEVQSISSVAGGALVKFYIMQHCPRVSNRWESGSAAMYIADIALDWSATTRKLLQTVTVTETSTPPVPSNVSATLRVQANDIDGGIRKGVITSNADMSTLQVQDDSSSSSTSTEVLSLPIIIVIAACAGIVLLSIIIGGCWYRSKNAKKLNEILDRSGVEFSAAATGSPTNVGVSEATSPSAYSTTSPRTAAASPPAIAVKRAAPLAPVRPAAAGGLPPNWSMQKTDEGHPYWFNSISGESTWTKPTA